MPKLYSSTFKEAGAKAPKMPLTAKPRDVTVPLRSRDWCSSWPG